MNLNNANFWLLNLAINDNGHISIKLGSEIMDKGVGVLKELD